MKVIDLLNKIANGEEVPKKIEAFYIIYELDEYNHYKHYSEEMGYEDLFDDIDNDDLDEILNAKVKIIEEKKIEKMPNLPFLPTGQITDKINEIIDKLNEVEK